MRFIATMPPDFSSAANEIWAVVDLLRGDFKRIIARMNELFAAEDFSDADSLASREGLN